MVRSCNAIRFELQKTRAVHVESRTFEVLLLRLLDTADEFAKSGMGHLRMGAVISKFKRELYEVIGSHCSAALMFVSRVIALADLSPKLVHRYCNR